MSNFNEFLAEQMKDPEFKAEWDALDPEFTVIEAILKARKESGLTQKQHRPTSVSWSGATQTLRSVHSSALQREWE